MRNGAGTYNLPQAPFTPGTVISSTAVNSNFSDIANALTQSLANDGQTVPTANLPMGTYRHTGVGNAVARTDYAAMGQVQDGAGIWCGTAGGTANALTLSPTPAIPAYAAGQVFRFTAGASANTGATTVAVSGLTAQAIQANGAALTGGEIAAGRQYQILYDGTAFQLQAFGATSATYAANTFVANATGSTAAATGVALAASQLAGRGSTGNVAALGVGGGVQILGTTLQLATGTIVDRAYAEYTTNADVTGTIPIDDTIPQSSEGVQILSVSITPKTSTNRIRLRFRGEAVAGSSQRVQAAVFSTAGGANALVTALTNLAGADSPAVLFAEFEHVPGTTTAQTYTVRVGTNGGGTVRFNGSQTGRLFGGTMRATIVLEEIVA